MSPEALKRSRHYLKQLGEAQAERIEHLEQELAEVRAELARQQAANLSLLGMIGKKNAAPTTAALYTCIGKGGAYELLGESTGAGLSRGDTLQVYREVVSGRLFHRTPLDWAYRMEIINNTVLENSHE